LLDQNLIRTHYPYLSEDVKAILHVRDAGWFSAHTLGSYLLERARQGGARVLQGEVVAVEKDDRGVCAVEVAVDGCKERICTRRFVNAAGPFINRVANMVDPGIDIPVKIRVAQKMLMKDYLGIVPRCAPMVTHSSELALEWSDQEKEEWCKDDEYRWLLSKFSCGPDIRPEGGKDSQWIMICWKYRQEAGRRVYVREQTWEPKLDDTEEYAELTLRAASALIPGLRRYLDRMPRPAHDGGYWLEVKDPATECFTQLPLIGPLGPDGAFLVNVYPGICCGCAAGALCAAWVAGGDLPQYAEEFSIDG
jgi:glycine/D-amino acid oxidase-like deaminating enzyme